jgi:tetratricopeptide (TPR) repeat protein
LYAGKARSTSGVSIEVEAGVVLASAEIIMPDAPEEARTLVEDIRSLSPPEPYAGEASLLLGKCATLHADWNKSLDIFNSLEASRVDDIGAQAGLQKARSLEAMGRTSEAIDEYLKVGNLFPYLGERVAEGLANAIRVLRERGERERAAKIEQALRKKYPASPWIETLSSD